MLRIAIVTEKASGNKFDVYRVSGDHGEDYAVWSRNGYACRCPCKSRQFRADRRCKHMLKLQAALDERKATAPLHR